MTESSIYFESDTFDDLLNDVLAKLLKQGKSITASRGNFSEIIGATLVLRNPRARLSRSESRGKIFSALGELFWYLSKSDDFEFIKYYIPEYRKSLEEDGTARSGYGERLFNFKGQNQVENVIDLLRRKRTSRRAVIQLFDSTDLSTDFKSIPCTCTLQFLVRENELHLLVNMRSNDAYVGLPHDVFAFTMLQEIIARSVCCELGSYMHTVGSLHLYARDSERAESYLSEGWQSPVEMPSMPLGDPWSSLTVVSEIEALTRTMQSVDVEKLRQLDCYWQDICRLFSAYQVSKLSPDIAKEEKQTRLKSISDEMFNPTYRMFIDGRIDSLSRPPRKAKPK